MKSRDKKTFTKVEQQMNKSTKQKLNREREHDENDWIHEEIIDYQTSAKNNKKTYSL